MLKSESDTIKKRTDFLDPIPEFDDHILVNYASDSLYFGAQSEQIYVLTLIGVNVTGHKIMVNIWGIRPFFYIRVPDSYRSDPREFARVISRVLPDSQQLCGTSIVMLKPGKGYYEHPVPWCKMEYTNINARRRCINYCLNTPFEEVHLETAHDEKNKYYNTAAADHRITISNWLVITGAEPEKRMKYNTEIIDRCYSVPEIGKIRTHKYSIDETIFVKPKIMTAFWDIETHSFNDAISTESETDDIIMINLTFVLSNVIIAVYNIHTLMPEVIRTPTDTAKYESIRCTTREEVLINFIRVMHAMRPDFISGFNDGAYDWPFILHKLNRTPIPEMCQHPNCLEPGNVKPDMSKSGNVKPDMSKSGNVKPDMSKSGNAKPDMSKSGNVKLCEQHKNLSYNKNPGVTLMDKFASIMHHQLSFSGAFRTYENNFIDVHEKIKIDASTNEKNTYFNPGGMLCVDMRTALRQIYFNDEYSSLNHFLSKFDFAKKKEMSYDTMAYAYRIYRCLYALFPKTTYSDLLNILKADADHTRLSPVSSASSRIGTIPDTDKSGSDPEGGMLAACNTETFTDYITGTIESKTAKKPAIGKAILAQLKPYLDVCGREKNPDGIMIPVTMARAIWYYEHIPAIFEYNNYDAIAVYLLFRNTNILSDRRENVDMCFQSMYEGLYRANGSKVRARVYSDAALPQWNLAYSCNTRAADVLRNDGKKFPGADIMAPKKGVYCTDALTKVARVLNIAAGEPNRDIDPETVNPQSPRFNRELLRYVNNPDLMVAEHPILADKRHIFAEVETNLRPDRGYAGLDAASMYPNMAIMYNLCLEKCITSPEVLAETRRLHPDWRIEQVIFNYGRKGETPENITGWFIQNYLDPVTGEWLGAGLYSTILKDIFDKRKLIKKDLGAYTSIKEFFNDVIYKVRTPEYLNALPLPELCVLIGDLFDAEIAKCETKYAEKPVAFNRDRLNAMIALKKSTIPAMRVFIETEIGTENIYKKSNFANLSSYTDEVKFRYNYYNSKSNAIKVYMNTFYGESGNNKSPLFMVQIAGAITHYGRHTIVNVVGEFLRDRGCDVCYGDTDSRYVAAPESVFAELDKKYHSGMLSKLEYFTEMVEMSMTYLDNLSVDLNQYIRNINGGKPFVNMMYEEVLFPSIFCGKKNYMGLPHVNLVNFDMCLPGITLEKFRKGIKKLMIRGLEVKKKGHSAFSEIVNYSVIMTLFNFDNTKCIRYLIYNSIRDVWETKYEPDAFYKSCKYNPKILADGKLGGNAVANGVVARMRRIQARNPGLNIFIPNVGERFQYVMCVRNQLYDYRGLKMKYNVADRAEIVVNRNNAAYAQILQASGEYLEIDKLYYISGDIIGQLAKFMLHYSEYEKFYNAECNTDPEEYKKCAAAAIKCAKKDLVNYLKTDVEKLKNATELRRMSSKLRADYKNKIRQFQSDLIDDSGVAPGDIMDIMEHISSNRKLMESEHVLTDVHRYLLNICTKKAEKAQETGVFSLDTFIKSRISVNSDLTPRGVATYVLHNADFVQYHKAAVRDITQRSDAHMKQLSEVVPRFVVVCRKYLEIVSSGQGRPHGPENDSGQEHPQELTPGDLEILNELDDVISGIAAIILIHRADRLFFDEAKMILTRNSSGLQSATLDFNRIMREVQKLAPESDHF